MSRGYVATTISNLNALLADIYLKYIQLNDEEFEIYYKVFDAIFQHLHQKMKEVDPYYERYSSAVQFAGSHYDNLRIKKPDEFDMDIVIGLPLNLREDPKNVTSSDIIIEPNSAGYVQLRTGVQFQRPQGSYDWQINKTAYGWKDQSNYLLQNKFLNWFTSVVNKALNRFENSNNGPVYKVDGVTYIVRQSASGPARTLIIENESMGFKLDVDLVPALKFPETRWPIGPRYREIPFGCSKGYWYVVGKKNMNAQNEHDRNRSWRLALHYQERELMHNLFNLKQTIRLIKKLRDSMAMNKISSYYIKTLFLWEIVERNNRQFWIQSSLATLFELMVRKLHNALDARKIPYFWNEQNNLIGNVGDYILLGYTEKLVPLIQIFQQPYNYKLVARYLLTPEEFADYNARVLHV